MYDYEIEKQKLFTDDGQREFLKMRDCVSKLLEESGAIMLGKVASRVNGDSWFQMACVDRLVELGEIVEIKQQDCWAQHRVFTRPISHR